VKIFITFTDTMINVILKKHWKNLLIVLMAISLFTSIRSCNVNDDRVNVASDARDSSYLMAHYYRNKNGELVGQVKTSELTIDQLKEFGGQLGFEVDGLKSEVGRLNRLKAHWEGKAGVTNTIETVLHDTTYVDKETGDIITAKDFKWNNKWMNIAGVIVNNDLTLTYQYTIDFSLTAYRKPQKGFWKSPGQLVTDIKFSDPNFKVTEFKGFVVTEERKRWYQTNGFKYGAGFLIGGYAAWRIQNGLRK
jgi:hypothetical protein